MLDACLPMYIHDGGFRSGGSLTGTLGQAVGIGEGKGKGGRRGTRPLRFAISMETGIRIEGYE